MKNQEKLTEEQQLNLRKDLKTFQVEIIHHGMLNHVEERTFSSITTGQPGNITAIIGPTGAGKTTVSTLIAEGLRDYLRGKEKHQGVVEMLLKANEVSRFNWKDFYHRLLDLCNEPLSAELRRPGSFISADASVDRYRRLLEEDLAKSGVKVVILDEAHHLVRNKKEDALEDQLYRLKSFSDMSLVHIVLIGTYELYSLVTLDDSLFRRVNFVHFPRYQLDSEHVAMFKDALNEFTQLLKPFNPVDLVDPGMAMFLWTGSVGCIGILQNWIVKSVAEQLNSSSPNLTREHFERVIIRPAELRKMHERIAKQEENFEFSKEALDELIHELIPHSQIGVFSSKGNGSGNGNGSAKSVRRVGRQKPKRFPTGEAKPSEEGPQG